MISVIKKPNLIVLISMSNLQNAEALCKNKEQIRINMLKNTMARTTAQCTCGLHKKKIPVENTFHITVKWTWNTEIYEDGKPEEKHE